MNHFWRDFISEEARVFRFRFGRHLASSLTGLIAGIVAASVVWVIAIKFLRFLGQ